MAIVWRDRIKEFRRVPVTTLQDNDGNWRVHPQHQRDALKGLLKEIGIAGALIVYESARNNGALTLIDGHLRKHEGGEWPILLLDVNDTEADLLLATLDPLVGLANANTEALRGLLHHVRSDDTALQQLLEGLSLEHQLLSSENNHDVDAHDFPDIPAPESNIRMVQLFLTNATYPAFEAKIQHLSAQYGTTTITDTVLEAIRHAADPDIYAA